MGCKRKKLKSKQTFDFCLSRVEKKLKRKKTLIGAMFGSHWHQSSCSFGPRHCLCDVEQHTLSLTHTHTHKHSLFLSPTTASSASAAVALQKCADMKINSPTSLRSHPWRLSPSDVIAQLGRLGTRFGYWRVDQFNNWLVRFFKSSHRQNETDDEELLFEVLMKHLNGWYFQKI